MKGISLKYPIMYCISSLTLEIYWNIRDVQLEMFNFQYITVKLWDYE